VHPWRSVRLILFRLSLVCLLFAAGIDLRVGLGGCPGIIDAAQVPGKPLIVVLGARVYRSGRPSAMLEDRLETALELQRARGGMILLSGDGTPGLHDEIRVMRGWLMQRGVQAWTLCDDTAGYDTYESLARLQGAAPARPVIIVTQRFHLARALYLARGLGLEARGVAADRRFYAGLPYNELRELGARMKAWFQIVSGVRLENRRAPLPAACPA
jgi:vancomycin permeability regulator SanA